jgi:hypothetical protein
VKLPRPLHDYVFRLQNMHFNALREFQWNVREFGPELERIMTEMYELGRKDGRREMAEKAGSVMTATLLEKL